MTTQQRQSDPYAKFKACLKNITSSQLLEIESMSSMTFEEIMAYFLIDKDEVKEAERKIILMAIARGRAKAIKKATDKLFSNMSDGKQGVQACLSYLKRFSKEFEKEVDDSEGSGGVSYNVNISAAAEPKEPNSAKDKLVAIK